MSLLSVYHPWRFPKQTRVNAPKYHCFHASVHTVRPHPGHIIQNLPASAQELPSLSVEGSDSKCYLVSWPLHLGCSWRWWSGLDLKSELPCPGAVTRGIMSSPSPYNMPSCGSEGLPGLVALGTLGTVYRHWLLY